MKIIVCAKRVAVLPPASALPGPQQRPADEIREWALNEVDSYALEAAVRARESRGDGEVIAASVGPENADAILRKCIAAGADRAIRVESNATDDPMMAASALAQVARAEVPDLIICGVQSADAANAATGAALAGYLDWPMATAVIALQIDTEHRVLRAVRELEGGTRERIEINLPAIISVQTGSYETRHPNLKAVKLSRRAPIELTTITGKTPVAARLRRMYLPGQERRAEMLGADAETIATRLLTLIQEQSA